MIEKRFGSEKKKKSLCHKCSLLDLHNKLVKIQPRQSLNYVEQGSVVQIMLDFQE